MEEFPIYSEHSLISTVYNVYMRGVYGEDFHLFPAVFDSNRL